MLITGFSETKKGWIDLRQQANYWKTQHAKVIEREAVWKTKVQELEADIRKQNEQIEGLKAQNVWLKHRIFGRQTEQNRNSNDFDDTTDKKDSCSSP